MTLFVYGTLMRRDLIESLLDRPLGDSVEASIHGYEKIRSEWGYPVIIPRPASSVEGVIWRNLTDRDLVALDRYEGCAADNPVYRRETHRVVTEGREEEAWVYVATAKYLISYGRNRK